MIKPILSLTVTGVSSVHLGPGEFHHLIYFFLCVCVTRLLLGTNPTSGQSHCAPWRTLVDNGASNRAAALGTQRLELRKVGALPWGGYAGMKETVTPVYFPDSQSCTFRPALGSARWLPLGNQHRSGMGGDLGVSSTGRTEETKLHLCFLNLT